MRSTTLLGLCLSLICLLSGNANATHIMGASITWDNIGKDSFKVTLKVYRDCTGTSLARPDLDVGCKSGSLPAHVIPELLNYNGGKDVTPVCAGKKTKCQSGGSFSYGFEEHIASFLVDLSNVNCCKVKFSYSECCRSKSITTGLDKEPYYVESWFDRCKAPANSSPEFNKNPIMLSCKGVKEARSQGAFDKDTNASGKLTDSLSHQLAKPLGNGPNDPLSYSSPYSFQKPIKFKGFPRINLPKPFGFSYANQTGLLQFSAQKVQTSVLKVSVEEYRQTAGNNNPVKIGEVNRDVQVFVSNCSKNEAPEVSEMGCSNFRNRVAEVCEGENFKTNFCTKDKDSKDTVSIDFKPGTLPGNPSFSVKNPNGKKQKGSFNWTAPTGLNKSAYYRFLVTAKDDNCPKAAQSAKNFRIQVKPIPKKPSYNIQPLSCGKYRIKVSSQNAESQLRVFTDGKQFYDNTFTYKFNEPNQTFPVKFVNDLDGCKKIAYDTIRTDSILAVDVGKDTTLCLGNTLEVDANVVFNNGPISYTWQDGVTNTAQRTFTNIQQDTTISVRVEDNNCTAMDSFRITIDSFGQNIQSLPDTSICRKGDTFVARTNAQSNQYQWSTGSTADSTIITEGGIYTLALTNQKGCTRVDSFRVRERLNRDLVPDSAFYCGNNSVTLKANAGNSNASYQWSNNQTSKSITVSRSGNYTIKASLNSGCQTADMVQVSQAAKPSINLGTDTSICSTDSIKLSPGKGYASYSWSSGDTTSSIWADKQGQYTVTVTTGRGCSDNDTFQLTTLGDCVWPGDANNDGVANNQDILDIGVKYNTSGKTRNNQGTQWDAYKSSDWSDTFNSGLNTKFADCDGNGTVQTNDTQAVSQNYGKTHNKRGLEGELKDGGVPLNLAIKQNNLESGDQAEVMLRLGKQGNHVQDFYGIAANLSFSGEMVKANQIRVKGQGTWLQSGDPNFITFGKRFNQMNKIEMAVTRTDQKGVSGQGTAAKLILPIKADTKGDTLQVSLQGEYLIGPKGEPITYDTGRTAIQQSIEEQNTGLTDGDQLSQHIQTYPNPASTELRIKVDQIQVEQCEILNPQGQVVKRVNLNKGGNSINVKPLPAGPYHLMIRTNEGVAHQTVIVK